MAVNWALVTPTAQLDHSVALFGMGAPLHYEYIRGLLVNLK